APSSLASAEPQIGKVANAIETKRPNLVRCTIVPHIPWPDIGPSTRAKLTPIHVALHHWPGAFPVILAVICRMDWEKSQLCDTGPKPLCGSVDFVGSA